MICSEFDVYLRLLIRRYFDVIFPEELKEFDIKLSKPHLFTFDKLNDLLIDLPKLESVKYRINFGIIRNNEKEMDYLNGAKWDDIRRQFHHLVHFDCFIQCQLFSYYNDSSIYEQIIASFSQMSQWTAGFFKVTNRTVCIYAYTNIEKGMLMKINGHQITTFADEMLSLDIDVYQNQREFLSLVLFDYVCPRLTEMSIAVTDSMRLNQIVQSFVKELFHRTSHLNSIEIHSTNDGKGYDDILNVLQCFDKPSINIEFCQFHVATHYDPTLIETVARCLPRLTSFIVSQIHAIGDLIIIINTSLIHFKSLLFLQLNRPKYLANHRAAFQTRENLRIWLKEHTLLGSSIEGRTCDVICNDHVQIWL